MFGGFGGGGGFPTTQGGNNPGIYNINMSNKQNKKEFTERIKRAQDNAEKGKYAIKIQRRYRAHKLKELLRTKNLQESLSKLKDLKIVATHEKVKAIFFLKIDKFSNILSLFSSS